MVLFGSFPTKASKVCLKALIHYFRLTIWLGWYAELLESCVSDKWSNSFQKWLKKILPRFETMDLGYPWSLTTSLVNAFAPVLVSKGCLNVMKWPYLLRRSTTINMVSHPWERGKPSTKSMLILSHICFGMDRVVTVRLGTWSESCSFDKWGIRQQISWHWSSSLPSTTYLWGVCRCVETRSALQKQMHGRCGIFWGSTKKCWRLVIVPCTSNSLGAC